jgi:hypothetical protein
MLLLIFKVFSWRIACQALLILILIQIISILLLTLIVLTIYYFYRCLILKKQIKSLIKYQENYCEKTAILIDVAKLSLLSINNLKNPLTSLRIILDELKDYTYLEKKKVFQKYLKQADQLLVKIKHKDDIIFQQLFPQEAEKLFDLKKEIESILFFYEEIFKQNGITINFNSSHEYRVFAQQDHLLRIINSVLLTSLQSLISDKKKSKKLKIYFIRTAYLLKIVIENNSGKTDAKSINGLIRLNCLEESQIDKFQLSLYFANKMMKKYFQKKIEIVNKRDLKTIICLKIKNCYILAEPKIKN